MRLRTTLIATLAALSLSLLAATAAQGAEWEINEAPLSSLEISGETLSSTGGAFELTVPALSLTIKCTSESGSGEVIAGGATSKVSFNLSGCVVSKFEKACSVKSPGKSTGVLSATATTKFFVKEVSKVAKTYDELVPTMTVEISGGECPYSSKLEMSGATAAEVPKPEEEAVERVQKFSTAIAEQSGATSLKLGGNQAFLIGEDKEALSGGHEEEALGITEVLFNPAQMFFTATGVRQNMWLDNNGPLTVKYTKIEIEAGPYNVIDDVPCKEFGWAADVICVIKLECLTLPSVGKLLVRWDVLDANLAVVSAGKRRTTLSCGAA